MVSGWVKTEADWATAAFSNMSSSAGVSLDGQAGGAARIRVSGSYTYSAAGPMMERQGCHYAQSTPTVHNNHSRCRTKDQCVFIKRYMVRRRFYFMRTIVAGAGYHDLPRGDNGNDGGSYIKHINGIEPEPARNMFDSNLFDPLSVLIYYIFETTAAEVAVVSDHDINIILDGQRIIDFASYLRKSQPPVEVDGPFGFICAEDVVSRERETSFSRRGINARDLQEWPASTFNGAASLETKRVLVGAPPEGAIPFKCHQLAFSDPLRQSTACTCCALSLDGNLLAASFDDSPLLYIWRIHDGLLLQRLEGHTKDISCITFAASGDAFVSGSADSTAIVWDTRHRRIRHHLEGHDGDIEMVAFSPCSSIIVTGSTFRGDCLKLWDAETGACLHSFTMLKRDMHTLQFSPDSSRLYIGLNYSCLIYNLRAHKHVAILRHRYGKALHWVLSRAGDRIVTATQPGGEVKIWCAITGSACLTINHPSGLTSPVEFAPDGAEVVACCDEGKALVCYDARTGQPRHVFTARHKIQCLAYSQDGQYLIVGDEGGDLQVFDAKARGLLYTYQAVAGGRSLKDTNFLPDSRSILVRSASGPLGLLNLRDAERLR
ncbi:WD40 repeat domain-containing protein [Phanerochaete sordida]|uniref:WD40 repeat domain-containing protein n=1 Tax=Phanerochaete sordida TaxID=48140 RepID=A0A9P3GTE5_9APHY|nr:WD40 repeat domain-containing protein [Phanerochaete sordida]